MPKALHDALRKEAAKRGYGKRRSDAYTYGTMRKTGWKPKGKKSGVVVGPGGRAITDSREARKARASTPARKSGTRHKTPAGMWAERKDKPRGT